MPHLVLEFSSNIIEKNNMINLFRECHLLLEKMLPTDINSCKSRSIEHTSYFIGNGDSNNAFIHISLKIMPGRSSDTLKNIGETMIKLFKNHFSESLKTLNLQITLEILSLEKNYFKILS